MSLKQNKTLSRIENVEKKNYIYLFIDNNNNNNDALDSFSRFYFQFLFKQ